VLDICQPRNIKERLIVNVGVMAFRVSNSSPAWDTIDRIVDVRVGDKAGSDYVDGNISDLNRSPCEPSQKSEVSGAR